VASFFAPTPYLLGIAELCSVHLDWNWFLTSLRLKPVCNPWCMICKHRWYRFVNAHCTLCVLWFVDTVVNLHLLACLLFVGGNVDVCWDAVVLWQLLLSCTDWQYSNTASYSVRWHVADSSMGIHGPLNRNSAVVVQCCVLISMSSVYWHFICVT